MSGVCLIFCALDFASFSLRRKCLVLHAVVFFRAPCLSRFTCTEPSFPWVENASFCLHRDSFIFCANAITSFCVCRVCLVMCVAFFRAPSSSHFLWVKPTSFYVCPTSPCSVCAESGSFCMYWARLFSHLYAPTEQDFREIFCVRVKKNVARPLNVILTFIRSWNYFYGFFKLKNRKNKIN